MEPASYAPAADRVRHLVYHSHDDDGDCEDCDEEEEEYDIDIYLTFSCFSLPLDDRPARRQSSPLAVSPGHFLHHFCIANTRIITIITISVTVAVMKVTIT